MTYTQKGPFSNNVPPSINAVFLDDLENWIVGIDNTVPSNVTGSTSGTANLYEIFPGTVWKYLIVHFNNYRNGSAPAQTLGLPQPFTAICAILSTDAPAFQLINGGSAINMFVLDTINPLGGHATSESAMAGYSLAQCGAWDTLSLNGSQASTHTGMVIFQGI